MSQTSLLQEYSGVAMGCLGLDYDDDLLIDITQIISYENTKETYEQIYKVQHINIYMLEKST